MGIFDSTIGASQDGTSLIHTAHDAVLATTRMLGGHHLRVDISKVSNGYVVSFDEERFIAENAEQVNGIVSAQLLKLGAK
jgi:hypothetical protein